MSNYTRQPYIQNEQIVAYFKDPLDVAVWVRMMRSKAYQITDKLTATSVFPDYPYMVIAKRNRTRVTITV